MVVWRVSGVALMMRRKSDSPTAQCETKFMGRLRRRLTVRSSGARGLEFTDWVSGSAMEEARCDGK